MPDSSGKFQKYQLALCQLEPAEIVPAAEQLSLEDRRPLFRWRAMSVAPEESPFAFIAVESGRGGITSQIALQMSLTSAVEKAQQMAEGPREEEDSLSASNIVREVFREANQQVYHYAHRMAAAGQVGATGLICAYDGQRFAVARVGRYESYLWRGGELLRLHQPQAETESEPGAGVLQRFIGANAQILVDLASVNLSEGDTVILSTIAWRDEFDAQARMILREAKSLDTAAQNLAYLASEFSFHRPSRTSFTLQSNVLILLLHVGRPIIALTQMVYEE